jgi:hypothetical protein
LRQGSHCAAQAFLEPKALFSQPPECYNYRHAPPHPAPPSVLISAFTSITKKKKKFPAPSPMYPALCSCLLNAYCILHQLCEPLAPQREAGRVISRVGRRIQKL